MGSKVKLITPRKNNHCMVNVNYSFQYSVVFSTFGLKVLKERILDSEYFQPLTIQQENLQG